MRAASGVGPAACAMSDAWLTSSSQALAAAASARRSSHSSSSSGRSRSIAIPGVSARAGAASFSRKMRATSRSAASCSSSSSCTSRRRSNSSIRRSQRSSSRRAASTRASTSRGCGLPGSSAHLSSQMPMSMSESSGGSCAAIEVAMVARRSMPSAVPSGQGITSKPVRSPHTDTSVSASGSTETSRKRKCGTSDGRVASHDDSHTRSGSVGRKPTNTSERRRATWASQARPGDATSRTRASPGPTHRLSGRVRRPARCSSGGPDDCACVGSSAAVSTTGGRRPPGGCSRAACRSRACLR